MPVTAQRLLDAATDGSRSFMTIDVLSTGHFYTIALALCMVWVVVSDTWNYIISNTLNAFILALYIMAVICLPIHDWPTALGAAVLILIVGLGLFALGLMGGGDIKLLVVLSLWTGWGMPTLEFIFMTAIFGGLLVIVVLIARAILPGIWLKARPTRNLPRILTRKQPVPYGIAIALAFSWLLWGGRVPGLVAL
ncbi:MAG: A24 family peptidase [Rickettsiales bacterium]